jgi:hypothetical protein
MRSRTSLLLAPLLLPASRSLAEIPPLTFDYGYQLYEEDDDRIRVEAHYLRGSIELDAQTAFRFQYLHDAISGSSPTGVLPGGVQPFYAELEDVREGILGAISRQFGDHRVEIEVSRSKEDDYVSRGLAITDTIELNQKNTTLTFGLNYLDDLVSVPGLDTKSKHAYDFFAGVSQILGKNTVVTANFTLGYTDGYLNDPYKVVQRDEVIMIPIGPGIFIPVPIVNIYRENRPDSRFRQVLQLGARHYFDAADGALDATLRLSYDDYGIFSQTARIEWRQTLWDKLDVIPFFRWYHQNEADFFVNTLNDVPVGTPSGDPDGSGPNYSADYRLSSLTAVSGGVKLNYRINEQFTVGAAYERYVMDGSGSGDNRSPSEAYPSADIWTFTLHAAF